MKLPKFAPFFVPLHRRLETASVLLWWSLFMFSRLLTQFVLFYMLITRYFWVSLLLFGWAYYDRYTPQRGGRRSQFMRSLSIWKRMADYFPVRLHKTTDLDPHHNYIVGFHPHGIMSISAFVNFSTEGTDFSAIFPRIRSHLCTLSVMYKYPLVRDFFMSGGMCDVCKESIDYLAGGPGRGSAAVIVLGGAGESLEAHAGRHVLCLTQRKGFIKKALQHGAHLVPCYSFGENDLYHQVPNEEGTLARRLQQKMQKAVGFATPFFYGRGVFNYSFGPLPFRREVNTVVGRPIPVEKMSEPTAEAIDSLWHTYANALRELFEENKVKFGVKEEVVLQIK
ncbi:2-acylglycerol O-acyltransferase 1-like [Diadema antillarum]|uniref:2-acylglycerol O-acyltransferase 1-like n=1 Tax=Diadema antillarum TaxID=105358 RepID=UPI003A838B09